MIKAISHRFLGGRLLDLDNPPLCDVNRDWDEHDNPSPQLHEEFKDAIGTVVRRYLKQFLSDRAALFTLTLDAAAETVHIDALVQVPADWKPTYKMELKKTPDGSYLLNWSRIESGATESLDEAPPSPAAALPLPLDYFNKKWSWIEYMPLPPFTFSATWDRLVWHMRKVDASLDDGILLARNERREVDLRVTRHGGTLIVIQRQCD